MKYIFFDGWDGIIRVIVSTFIAYIVIIIILRISGKRTLAKMNAFDFVVTIALGSILGAVILNNSIPLAEGLLAACLLIFLQYCITYYSVRSVKFKNFISSNPSLLFYDGKFLEKVLKKERIAMGEINKSVREAGLGDLTEVEVIVLESTGDITIVKKMNSKAGTSVLSDVKQLDTSD